MRFYKYIYFCFFLLPFSLILSVAAVDMSDQCVNHPSGINPFFRTGEYHKCDDLLDPPVLNEFDKAVLDICGDWGNTPKVKDFKDMLNKKEYKKYVDEIYQGLNHQVVTPNADLDKFKNELAELWFNRDGFTHIMCGQPRRSRLSGMHFFGRYIQAQENKWAGRHYDSVSDEISDKVFTIGVVFKNRRGELVVDHRKGYDFLHANEIILHATNAYKGFAKGPILELRRAKHCLYDSEGVTYVFVARKGSIVTFFADLTPNCAKGETECSCIQ
ncbi:EndoU domain-containing protein [Ehrlichia muris]|uniref:Bacterial EndoU nuclease domain-containing protein n=1 Tax=Ehrlichia muris AS145 TaxID=1423892 RepID=V9R5K4_9RICK|nr:EndoU domain-containing protein [Ehrlichia muris]AHC39017.1 hypothetical protein EMUR_00910 [Ehrlichia muris AS145]